MEESKGKWKGGKCSVCSKVTRKSTSVECSFCNEVLHVKCIPSYADKSSIGVKDLPFFYHKYTATYMLKQ